MQFFKNRILYVLYAFFVFSAYSVQAQHFIEVLPENTSYEESSKLTFIDNFKSSYNSKWSTYIQINDVVNWQTRGRLDFSISNMMIEPCELQAVDVSFENSNKYRWRGTSADQMLDLTIIKNSEGYSGILLNHYTLQKFYILPVNTTKSVLIETETSDRDIRCGNDTEDTEDTEHTHAVNEECYNDCPGHIDILFLITPEAEMWMVESEIYATYLDLMIAELYLVFGNDNILHTVDYNWVSYTSWSDDTDVCKDAATNLSNNPDAQQLRQDNHADIVVCLVPPGVEWFNANACVPSVEPAYENAFVLLPIDVALIDFIFVHEVGHTFGAEHSNDSNFKNFSLCADDYLLDFPAILTPTGEELYPAYQRGTVLRGFRPIPHYSDPHDTFNGIATGDFSSPTVVVPKETNNAGRVRGTGCDVGNFEPSPIINVNVAIDESNACSVDFQAFTNIGGTDDFEYEWFWSYEGFFSSQYPGTITERHSI